MGMALFYPSLKLSILYKWNFAVDWTFASCNELTIVASVDVQPAIAQG